MRSEGIELGLLTFASLTYSFISTRVAVHELGTGFGGGEILGANRDSASIVHVLLSIISMIYSSSTFLSINLTVIVKKINYEK